MDDTPARGAAGMLTAAEVDAMPPAPEGSSVAVEVAKVTGVDGVTNTGEKWAIYGTDLGIVWDNGQGQVLAAFGDTFGSTWYGPGGNGNDWRSNVLLRSDDRDLADGLAFSEAAEDWPGHAGQLIPSLKADRFEITVIPTSGLSVGSRQYLTYMSVRQWGTPGGWDTNYGSLAYSDDNGATWQTDGAPRWDNADGASGFQMGALAKREGWVYLFATPNGRYGPARLARVPEGEVLDGAAYEYWDGQAFTRGAEASAAEVFDAPVGELSVAWNEQRGLWLAIYANGPDLVLRTATQPEGPWTEPQLLLSASDFPGFYCGFIHPWSSGDDLYFMTSRWDTYGVYLMRVGLDAAGRVVAPATAGRSS
jgi:hypothetical protein